jgi:NADPH-dependent curcumin reductase CurA
MYFLVLQHFEEIFQRNLTVRGFVIGSGESAKMLDKFDSEVIPLVKEGKINSREHRYLGLREAGKALADVHLGKNTSKAVIVVSDEE